jgi:hypothetical protein
MPPSVPLARNVPAAWPVVRLAVLPRPSGRPPEPVHDGDRCVRVLEDPASRLLVADRVAGTATLHGPPIPDDELAHPFLGAVATIFARWHERHAFHGGAFIDDGGRAIAVLGTKEAGKSTLMAALAAAGAPVLADDMLVIGAGNVCVGPRTVDLRAAPGPSLTAGAAVSLARGGSRWRVALSEDIPAEVPLGGWVFLEAGPDLEVEPVALSERLVRLARWRAWQRFDTDPAVMLALAGHPAWRVVVPHRWDALAATVSTLRHLRTASTRL